MDGKGKRRAVSFVIILLFNLPAAALAQESPQKSESLSRIFQKSDSFLNKLAEPVPIYQDRVKAKFGGEFRYRLELRDDFNFNDAAYEDDALNLFRSRLNLDLSVGPYLRVFAEGQDAESIANSSLDRTSAFVNRLDLRQLYTEAKSPWKQIPLAAKVGRQELNYGDQRFVGAFGWSNVARVFDAVKLVYTPFASFQVDSWFSQVVPVNRSQPDSAAHNDNFYGLYTSLKPIQDHAFDTFLFIRHDRNNGIAGEKPGELGQLKEYTLGNRFKGKKWNFDYGVEWAWQFGSRAHDDIKAWAWHNEAGYTFDFVPWDPRISFEYNHGSGDSDSRDGDYENFDNLFPTNHLFYGYMDFFSLRNMDNIKLGCDVKPHARIKFSTDYHWFFLDTNGSAWFNAGQGVIRPARSGASTTVGQEADLLATWKMTDHLSFMTGYSHFHAGPFARDTGAHDNAHFFYAQTVISL